jgi:nitrogenase-stabilizing/protective protein
MTPLARDIEALSSAEEFFAFFGLDYDPRVLAASRLHILKRFHDNLAAVDGLDDLDETAQRAAYREQLSRAYAAFMTGSALTMRVFPRLRQPRGAFVALSSVRPAPKSGQ